MALIVGIALLPKFSGRLAYHIFKCPLNFSLLVIVFGLSVGPVQELDYGVRLGMPCAGNCRSDDK